MIGCWVSSYWSLSLDRLRLPRGGLVCVVGIWRSFYYQASFLVSCHPVWSAVTFVKPHCCNSLQYVAANLSHLSLFQSADQWQLKDRCLVCRVYPPWGTPLPPCPFTSPSFPLLLFSFFHWLYLVSSFVHPFPFYQNSPTLFPGRRS